MRRSALILLVSWAYAGCAVQRPSRPPSFEPPSGGGVRIVTGQTLNRGDLRRWASWAPVVSVPSRPGLAQAVDPPPGGASRAGCWLIALHTDDASGNGHPTPAEIRREWEARLAEPSLPARALLRPVDGVPERSAGAASDGVAGLEEEDGKLKICVTVPTPDLPQRLAHPALWLKPAGPPMGRGPFSGAPGTVLASNPDYAGPPPRLRWIEMVDAAGHDPALLLRVGEADAAILYGPSASALIERPTDRLRVERWPELDRVYLIRFHLARRWVSDPSFRRWLADSIQRESILRYVFDERGEIGYTLSHQDSPRPSWRAASRRPFTGATRPHLSLDYPRDDRFAAAIAERVRASMALEGLSIVIRGRPLSELVGEGLDGSSSMALLSHSPRSVDPVLALLETVGLLGPRAAPFLELLDQASRLERPADRQAAAWFAEDALLIEANVAPLIRAHAWLAVDRGLEGVAAGPDGMPSLERAWWRP